MSSRFHLGPVGWFQRPEVHHLLPELAAAVWSGRLVQLRYDRWKAVVDCRVPLLGLVLKSGLRYLVAAVERQPRSYRVSSIPSLVVEEKDTQVPPRFELQRHCSRFATDYKARMEPGRARVRACASGQQALARMSYAMAQDVRVTGPADSAGWQELDTLIGSVEVAVGEFLRLAPELQALEPPAQRAALRKAAQALHGLHGVRGSRYSRHRRAGKRAKSGSPSAGLWSLPLVGAPYMSEPTTDARRRVILQISTGLAAAGSAVRCLLHATPDLGLGPMTS